MYSSVMVVGSDIKGWGFRGRFSDTINSRFLWEGDSLHIDTIIYKLYVLLVYLKYKFVYFNTFVSTSYESIDWDILFENLLP